MNPSAPETPQIRAVRLSCATPRFENIADDLVRSVRRAMGVPDRAEPDVEQEFAALRVTLDHFYPEFAQLFSGLLSAHLGAAESVVLSSLESQPVQAYLQAADAIDAEVNACLRAFVSRIGTALGAAPPVVRSKGARCAHYRRPRPRSFPDAAQREEGPRHSSRGPR